MHEGRSQVQGNVRLDGDGNTGLCVGTVTKISYENQGQLYSLAGAASPSLACKNQLRKSRTRIS
jgi:hypothetical protein